MRAFVLVVIVAGGFLSDIAKISSAQPVTSSATVKEIAGNIEATESPVEQVRDYVVGGGHNAQRQFIVIDKQDARLFVFSAHGKLEAESPILLGAARGDFSVPGIGERRLANIKPHEKTTPAGSFFSRPGHNLAGEEVIWLDYDAGVSMHRIRATNPAERRLERLASETSLDNRISYGCINVPKQFYERRVRPVFRADGAWVYVIPETMPFERLSADGPSPSTELLRAVRQARP
jgi:hypothetical protein